MAETGNPVTADGMKAKKAELAALAENKLAGTGWLPEPARISASLQKEVDQN